MRRKKRFLHLSPIENFVADYYQLLREKGFSEDILNELGLYSRLYLKKFHLPAIDRERLLFTMSTIPHYDVICARYGIKTKRLTCAEYAIANGISDKEARIAYSCGSKRFYQILAFKLYYCNEPALVFGHPDSKTQPVIFSEESPSLVRIFFWPKKFDVDEAKLKTLLNGLIFNGNCIGYDGDRIPSGVIAIHFNPAYQNIADRRYVISEVVAKLKKMVNPFLVAKADDDVEDPFDRF